MSLSNINWPTYQPTYAGAPIQAVASTLDKLDKRHWENVNEATRLQAFLADLDIHPAAREQVSGILDNVSTQLEDLSKGTSYARATGTLNNISKKMITDPTFVGAMKDTGYIRAKKEDIENKYVNRFYSKEQRDYHLSQLEQGYTGVKINPEHNLHEAYSYSDGAKFVDFDKDMIEQGQNFKFDSISSTNVGTDIAERRDSGTGDKYRVRSSVSRTTSRTPAEDFARYYRLRLNEDPELSAYVDEVSKIRGVDKEEFVEGLVNRAKQRYYSLVVTSTTQDEERIQGGGDVRIFSDMVSTSQQRVDSLYDASTYNRAIAKQQEYVDRISNAALSLDRLTSKAKDAGYSELINDLVSSAANNLDMLDADIIRSLNQEHYRLFANFLPDYILAFNSSVTAARNHRDFLDMVGDKTFTSMGMGDRFSNLEEYLNSEEFEENSKKAKERAIHEVQKEYAATQGQASRTGGHGFGYVQAMVNELEKQEGGVDWINDPRFSSTYDDVFTREVGKVDPYYAELNKQLKQYSENITESVNVYSFGTSSEDRLFEKSIQERLSLGVDKDGGLDVIDFKTKQEVPLKERQNWNIILDSDMPLSWIAEGDGRFGVVYRVKITDGKGQKQERMMVSYNLSDGIRDRFLSSGKVLPEHLDFVSKLSQATSSENGGSGTLGHGISVRRIDKTDDPIAQNKYMYVAKFPVRGPTGNIEYEEIPFQDYRELYREYYNYVRVINSKLN